MCASDDTVSIMTPNELTQALDSIRWSGRDLAAELDCAPNTVDQMRRGLRRIPEVVAKYLLRLVAAHQEARPPAPEEWRQRVEWIPQTKRAPAKAPAQMRKG